MGTHMRRHGAGFVTFAACVGLLGVVAPAAARANVLLTLDNPAPASDQLRGQLR